MATYKSTAQDFRVVLDGTSGTGISKITNYYLATAESDGITTATSGWTTTVQTISKDAPYLWNYEIVYCTDDSTYPTEPHIIGVFGEDGENGVGIESITEYYALSTSNEIVTGAWGTIVQTITATQKYLWNYEVVNYSDGTTQSTEQRIIGAYGDAGADGTGVNILGTAYTSESEYVTGQSYTLYSDSGLTTKISGAESGDSYLVNGYLFVYSATDSAFTCAGVIQGEDGVGISLITNYYLATSSSSGVNTSTAGWTTTIQTVTTTKKYLWNYEVITYTDGNKAYTSPCIIGVYGDTGDEGVGISSITEYYAVSSSNTSVTGTWSTSIPTMTAVNRYLWNYEIIKYTDGTSDTGSQRIIGVYGDTGSPGDDGVGVDSVTAYYKTGSSSTTKPSSPSTSTWSTSTPSVGSTEYLWVAYLITYTDGSTSWTEPYCVTDASTRERVTTLETDLTVVQGQISSKVWQTDIDTAVSDLDGEIKTLSDQYTAVNQTVSGLVTQVGNIETTVSDNYESLSSQFSTVEATANKVSSTVSSIQTEMLTESDLDGYAKEVYSYVRGTIGAAGIVRLCTMTVTSNYANAALRFNVTQRGIQASEVIFRLANADSKDPSIAFLGNTGGGTFYATHEDTSTYSLWALKSEAYDAVSVVGFEYGTYMASKISVEWATSATEYGQVSDVSGLAELDSGYVTSTKLIGYNSTSTYATQSDITQLESSISLSVSSVQTQLSNLSVGGRNYLRGTKDFDSELWTKSSNVTLAVDDEGYTVATWAEVTTLAWNCMQSAGGAFQFSQIRDKEITVSLDVRSDDYESLNADSSHGLVVTISLCTASSTSRTLYRSKTFYTTNLSDEWERLSYTVTASDSYFSNGSGTIDDTTRCFLQIYDYSLYSMEIRKVKLEIGNTPTDWTPAPEDMATQESVDTAQETANTAYDTASSAVERVSSAELTIDGILNQISMLVTDSNGTSLMTQTSDGGWTFSMSQTQATLDSISSSLDGLQNSYGDTESTVSILQQAVDDLESTAEYIRITTYEDEPCIELGESDSDFKLLITNTRIMFQVGSDVPTYISNTGLITENITVNNNLQQGDYVWSVRSNGNYGLRYVG